MHKLDMKVTPESSVWRNCKVSPLKNGRHWLETPKDTAIKFLETNLDERLARIPKEDRDRLILTGGVPQWAIVTVMRRFACFFKELELIDQDSTTIEISNPPADTESVPD